MVPVWYHGYMKLIFAILCSILLVSCAAETYWAPCQPTIKFDKKQREGVGEGDAHPYVGEMVSASGRCSAVLVGEQVALTALHCMPMETFVGADGQIRLFFGVEVYGVEAVFLFPEDTPLSKAVVLGLSRPVKGIKPIRIAKKPHKPTDKLSVVGFGAVQLCLKGKQIDPLGSGAKRTQYATGQEVSPITWESQTIAIGPGDSGGALVNETTHELLGLSEAIWWDVEPAFYIDRAVFTPVIDLHIAFGAEK